VRSYKIDQGSGSISPVGNGSPVPTDQGPSAIAASPDGLSLFVANAVSNDITVYTVAQDGSLTLAPGPPTQAGIAPMAFAVDSKYNLLFVANFGSDSITVFSITPGLLTLKGSFPIQQNQTHPMPNSQGPVALAISPAGFTCTDIRTLVPVPQNCFVLYAANQTAGTVTAYDYFVDSSGSFQVGATNLSGTFVPGAAPPGSPYPAGTFPSALAFARCAGAGANPAVPCQSGGANGLFVANADSNDLTVFSACIQLPTCGSGESSPDGSLKQIGSSVPTGGTIPSAILVDPGADLLYVVNAGSNQISTFSYTESLDTLTLGPVILAPATSVFSGGAVTPLFSNNANPRSWLVIWGNSNASGAQTLSVYGTGAGGGLTPATAPTFSGQAAAIAIR